MAGNPDARPHQDPGAAGPEPDSDGSTRETIPTGDTNEFDPASLDRDALIQLATRQADRLRALEELVSEHAPSPAAADSGTSWEQLSPGLSYAGRIDFHMMVERCAAPMVVTLMDGTVLYANRAALAVMEVEPGIDRPLVDREFFVDPAMVEAMTERHLAGENPVRERCQLRTARDRVIDTMIVSHAVLDGGGNIAYYVATFHDVTFTDSAQAQNRADHARTTRRLVRTEARYQTLFREIPEAIFLVDPDFVIVDVNPATTRLVGLDRDDIVGQRIERFIAGRRMHNRLMQGGDSDQLTTGRLNRPDGGVREIEGHVQSVHMDGHSGLMLVVRDVTWERNAQARIRMLSDAIDAMPKGAVILTPEGAVRYANAAFASRYGCSPEDMVGSPVESLGWYLDLGDAENLDVMPPAPTAGAPSRVRSGTGSRRHRVPRVTPLPDPLAAAVRHLPDGSRLGLRGPLDMRALVRPWTSRLVVMPPGGEPYPARVVSTPVFDEPSGADSTGDGLADSGACVMRGVVVVIADLTAEEQIQEHLLQAEKLASMGTLVGGLTRELNTHLAPIIGFAQLLGEHLTGSSGEAAFYLQRIQEAAGSARTIMAELLSFAMPPGGASPQHVGALARDVAALLEYPFREQSVTLDFDVDDSVRINGNKDQLRSMLLHLVRNAMDASPRNARVHLQITEASGIAEIRVTDEGEGLTSHVQAHMFDPFFTTRGVGKGIGLGLSVCYGVVRDLGGAISGSNRTDGRRGATFVVRLPASRVSLPDLTTDAPAPDATTSRLSITATGATTGGAGGRSDSRVRRKSSVSGAHPPVAASAGSSSAPTSRRTPSGPAITVPDHLAGRTILIVDDEPSMVSLLTRLFSSRGFVVRAFTDPSRALSAPDASDLVITDVWMPSLDGLQFREEYTRRWPDADTRFIFITGDTADDELERSIRSMGDTVVKKPFDIASIIQQAVATLGGAAPTSDIR